MTTTKCTCGCGNPTPNAFHARLARAGARWVVISDGAWFCRTTSTVRAALTADGLTVEHDPDDRDRDGDMTMVSEVL